MADFSQIIQEINTNLPDNNTQAITAAKLRTTLIDLTNQIDTVQDDFETEVNQSISNLVVDNLTSTDETKALSANQGRLLNDKIDDVIDNIDDFSYYTAYTDLEYSTWGEGHYISGRGNINIHGNYYIRYFNVQAGHTYRIHRNIIYGTSSAALVYAIYNTSTKEDWSSSTCVQYSENLISNGDLDIEITINSGGVVLALTCLGTYEAILQDITKEQMSYQEIKEQLDSIATPIDEVIEDSSLPITSGGVYDALDFSRMNIYTDLEYLLWEDHFLRANGNIRENSSYDIRYFTVQAGHTYRIHRGRLAFQGAAIIYAVYNTSTKEDWSSSTCVQYINTTIPNGDLDIEITINSGGVVLALSIYPTSNYYPILQDIDITTVDLSALQEQTDDNTTDITTINGQIADIQEELNYSSKGEFCSELDSDGSNYYASWFDLNSRTNEGVYTEYVYWFKKCMANELFTFYRVGFRTVSDRNYADTIGLNTSNNWTNGNITVINETGSDNIGPIGFDTVGNPPISGGNGLVGGNHRWNNDTTLNVKTAKTDSYACYCDNRLLQSGQKMWGNRGVIKVVNTIYDPAETPTTGQTILTYPISTETVYYAVDKNNIEVSLHHKLTDRDNVPNRYYGMQSMFVGENYVLTPRGQFDEWSSVASSNISFTKGNYPNFNRFIEKNVDDDTNQNLYYQSAYLKPNKNGSHNLLSNDNVIFNTAGSKTYHHIFSGEHFTEPQHGLSIVWSGTYTFFSSPILDDSNAFIYRGVIDGKDAIFVNTFQGCNIEVSLPEDLIMYNIVEIERDTNITTDNTFIDTTGIHIISDGSVNNGKGSFIFTVE